MRGDAVEYLDVVDGDAATRLQVQLRQNLGCESQHFEICRCSTRTDQFTAKLRVLTTPLGMRLCLLPENRRCVAETQWSRSFRQKGCGHARNGTCYVRTQCQQAPVVVSETKTALSFTPAHSLLEKIVVIDRRRDHLFVIPAFEDRHRDVFDGATQTRFGADVVAHSGWNSGGHLSR